MVFAISQRSDADIGSYNPSVSWKSGKLFNIKYILEFFGGLYVWNWWLYGTKTKISYWSVLWIGTGSICLDQLLVGWAWPEQFGVRTSPWVIAGHMQLNFETHKEVELLLGLVGFRSYGAKIGGNDHAFSMGKYCLKIHRMGRYLINNLVPGIGQFPAFSWIFQHKSKG